MFVIPAIDLIGGETVRLEKGNFNAKTIYNADPVKTVESLVASGFTRIHIVDLDGAKNKQISHLQILKKSAFERNARIDFGGGVRSIDDVEMILNAGAAQCTIGSLAVKDPKLIREIVSRFGSEKVLIGADVMNEQIKISGWLQDGEISIMVFLKEMIEAGVNNFFCTDISKDGMLEGPSLLLYDKILKQLPGIQLIASGGVRNLEDLKDLKSVGCCAAIVGKAIYEESIPLEEWANFK